MKFLKSIFWPFISISLLTILIIFMTLQWSRSLRVDVNLFPFNLSNRTRNVLNEIRRQVNTFVYNQTRIESEGPKYGGLMSTTQEELEGMEWENNIDCTKHRRKTSAEDLLCLERKTFLMNYRNPCYYENNSTLRCLPYFQIIGVCKSGTSDLFKRMLRHPQIVQNKGILKKETWFWTWRRHGNVGFHTNMPGRTMMLSTFLDLFDAKTIQTNIVYIKDYGEYHPLVTGHGDPMDFWDQASWRDIPQNDQNADEPVYTDIHVIRHLNPNLKLILLLRDPVERLFSNYLHASFGSTADEFHKDVLLSLDLLNNCTRNKTMRACLYTPSILGSLRTPISGSFYSLHLKEWLKAFPRKQMFITRTEDFGRDILGTLVQIFRFLRLEAMPTKDLYQIAQEGHYYITSKKSRSGNILNETRILLNEYFNPYNEELAHILGNENYLWDDMKRS
ncbi:hypothetical protein CHS0354_022695 [Potamilus streckersoni]|nr:hypothetical protein CHS0354_022695 [Potamilus streckersoni]